METAKNARSCSRCQGRMYYFARQGDRGYAKACECAQKCTRCEGRGYLFAQVQETFSVKVGPKNYEVLTPCPCQLLQRRLQYYNDAGIPAVLAASTFETYQTPTQAQAHACEVAKSFSLQYPQGRGFVIAGPVGTGKTHLLAATLAHAIIEKGARARYVEMSLLFNDIRRGFQQGKSGGEVIGPLAEVDLLAIDELGRGRGSPFELDTIDDLIARRYNAGKLTLFATNYSLAPPELKGPTSRSPSGYKSTEDLKSNAKESQLLVDRIGERIYSRLCDMCTFIEFPPATPDMRRQRQELEGTHYRSRTHG